MPADPVAIARDLLRCPSVTPAEGGALAFLESVLKGAGFTVHRMTFREPGTDRRRESLRPHRHRGAASRCSPATPTWCRRATKALDASAVRRRDRRRRAVRPRRGRHEGRHRLQGRGGARPSRRARRQAEGLDLVPDHRRRGRHRGQRHAQAAEMGGRARRKIRPLHARRAEQPSTSSATRSRSAGAARRTACWSSPARRATSPIRERADNPVRGLVTLMGALKAEPLDNGSAQFDAVEPRIHLDRCRQHDRQSHSRRGARALQHPLQRQAHARVAESADRAARREGRRRQGHVGASNGSRRTPTCSSPSRGRSPIWSPARSPR